MVKTTSIYYLSFPKSGFWAWLDWVLCSGSHENEVSARAAVSSEVWGLLQCYCGLNSVSGGCRTEVPFSCWCLRSYLYSHLTKQLCFMKTVTYVMPHNHGREGPSYSQILSALQGWLFRDGNLGSQLRILDTAKEDWSPIGYGIPDTDFYVGVFFFFKLAHYKCTLQYKFFFFFFNWYRAVWKAATRAHPVLR